jgi:hypothetical protein
MLMSWVLAAGLSYAFTVQNADSQPITLHRLRSLDAVIRATIDVGCQRSRLFGDLVADIEHSNYFVYVQQVPSLRGGMEGALVHGGAGPRYLRVLLKRGLSLERRIAVLAHELQHVREVVEAAATTDGREMEALFQRIGSERRPPGGLQQEYETAAALRVSDITVADLRASRHTTRGADGCRTPAH